MSTYQKSISKKGIKRAWCKKKLRQLFTVLTSSNNARVETTSKTLQLNKAHIYCSTILLLIIVTVRPASAITPVIMVGNNASDTAAKAEKACSFMCHVAFTMGKFVKTKEGRTALIWLAWSGVSKGFVYGNLLAAPSYGTAAIALALFCSAAYGMETVIGSDTFIGGEFLHHANKWCVGGYSVLQATAVLPKDAINYAINFLEAMKNMG